MKVRRDDVEKFSGFTMELKGSGLGGRTGLIRRRSSHEPPSGRRSLLLQRVRMAAGQSTLQASGFDVKGSKLPLLDLD